MNERLRGGDAESPPLLVCFPSAQRYSRAWGFHEGAMPKRSSCDFTTPQITLQETCLHYHSHILCHPRPQEGSSALDLSSTLFLVVCRLSRELMHLVLEEALRMGHRAAPHFADRDQCLKGNRIVSCTVRTATLRSDFQVSVLFRNPIKVKGQIHLAMV